MLEKEATHMPLWFHKEYDPLTNTMMHVRVLGGELKGRLGGGVSRHILEHFIFSLLERVLSCRTANSADSL